MLMEMIAGISVRAEAAPTVSPGDYIYLGQYNGERLVWRCVDTDENGPLMLLDRTLGGKAFSASENGLQTTELSELSDLSAPAMRRQFGTNRWSASALREWLNSDAEHMAWEAAPPYDAYCFGGLGYAAEGGFLSADNFTAEEGYAIRAVAQRSVLAACDEGAATSGSAGLTTDRSAPVTTEKMDAAYAETVVDRVFCMDLRQYERAAENYPAYVRPDVAGEQYWLRTPMYERSYAVFYATVYGVTIETAASNAAIGVRPAFYLNTDALNIQSGTGKESSPYVIYGSTPVGMEEIRLSSAELQLGVGMTCKLEASILPENANDKTVSWSSSDEGVAVVAQDGTVTAVSTGTATIRVASVDGSVSAECALTVTERLRAVFEDDAFRQAIIDLVFQGERELTDVIYADELNEVTALELSNRGITDLNGLAYFTALESLNCSGNRIRELDVSANGALTTLDCTGAQMLTLNVSGNRNLTHMYCAQNNLLSLDTASNTALLWLDCSGNKLTDIDLSHNSELQYLYIGSNDIAQLDLSACGELKVLECQNNLLSELDLSANPALVNLNCLGNQLTELNLGAQSVIRQVLVRENRLEQLDITANTQLAYLDCSRNYFKAQSAITGLREDRTTLVYYPQYLIVIPVESVTISAATLTLRVGETATLSAEVLPQGATNKGVRWSSDDPAVASVSESGRITAYAPGQCTVRVTTDDGALTDSCVVEVTDEAPPTVPTGLRADCVTGSGAVLSWQRSTDNVRVLRYDIYRNDELLTSTTQTSFADDGLDALTEYSYQVAAVDPSGNSSVRSAAVTVVPRAPVITRTEPANGGTFGGEGTQRITVYYNNTNNSSGATLSVAYQNTLGEWESVPFDVSITQGQSGASNLFHAEFDKQVFLSGDYRFRFTVMDRDQNADSWDVTYTVDRTPPQRVEELDATAGEECITLSWAVARDADVVRYEVYRAGTIAGTYQLYGTVNGRTNTSYTDKAVFANELYYYKVAAVDGFGQRSELTDPVCTHSSEDTTPPTITKLMPQSGMAINGATTITVSASDNIAVAAVTLQYSFDENNWLDYGTKSSSGTASFALDTTRFVDGDIYIRAVSLDIAGNASNGRPVYHYTVDNTGPGKVVGVHAIAVTATTATLSWQDVEDIDFGYFAVERQNNADGSFSSVGTTSTTLGMNLYSLTPGTEYTYRVVAYDTLGNRGIASELLLLRTASDTTAPVITKINPGANRYATEVAMQITAGDDHLVNALDIEYSYDLQNWTREASLTANNAQQRLTFSYTLELRDKREGSLYVRPVAFDAARNASDRSGAAPFVEYYVDRTAPATPEGFSILPGNGYIELRWQQGPEEDLAGYTVYRSEAANGTYTAIKSGLKQINYIDKNISMGTVYYYKIAVSDAAGNASAQTDYLYAQMSEDTEAPIVYSISPSDGYVIARTTKINVLAGDNRGVAEVTLEYLAPSGVWTPLETKAASGSSQIVSFSLPEELLPDGTYSFQAFATDQSGNVSEASQTYHYTIDSAAPMVTDVTCAALEEGVTIRWNSGMEPDLSGFYIYRRSEGGSYVRVGSVSAKGQEQYEYNNYNLNSNTRYRYQITAVDSVGNQSSAESPWISPKEKEPVPDTIAPVAVMNLVPVMEVGVEEYFDAGSSADNVEIVSYHWDFGDGTSSARVKTAHSYEQVGAYTVCLTVTDAAGNQGSKTGVVKVEERKHLGSVTIQVRDTYGSAVVGAGVYFNLGSEDACVFGTNARGEVTLREYEGVYSVGVYCDGYLPAKLDVQIIKNKDDAVYTVVIEKKEIIVGELTHKRMTLDEIIAAGIDPYSPENQNVYQFEIVLTYGAEEYKASGITKNTSDPVKLTVTDTKDSVKRDVYVWHYSGGGGGGGGSTGIGGGAYTQTPKTIIAVIEMPGEASWLKEFFDVHLHLENQADTEFAIDDCMVTLNYPENGLTLMTGLVDQYSESKTVSVGTIYGQQEKDIYWILRGDKAGEYNISADFSGTLREFNETITARFEDAEPIVVYGSTNLFLDIWVEDSIAPDTDSAVRVGITNEGPVDVYLPKIQLKDLERIRGFKTYGGVVVNTDEKVLAPGESIWADYRIPRSMNETLSQNADKEFYLYSAIVNSVGGNVTMQHRFHIVPAFSISPDIVNVYRMDSAGGLQPLQLIETSRGLSTKVPDIVVETLTLDENMQITPVSREITVKDEYLIKKKTDLGEHYGSANLSSGNDQFVVKTDSNGRFTLKGYEIKYAFKTMDPYNITISTPRAVTKQIPVVMRDAYSETTVVEGHVYYRGGGVRSPLSGAEVSIGETVKKTDKDGRFYFSAVGLGKNEIRIRLDGYEEIVAILSVSEDEKIDYYLNRIDDPNAPHIKSVSNAKFSTKNGNATIIPEGKLEGNVQFIISSELMGETFLKYRYYIKDKSGKDVSSGDLPASVFSIDLSDLKAGERLLFSVVTRDATGRERESALYDTQIVIAKAPGFLANIAIWLDDLDGWGKTSEFGLLDQKLPVKFTTETQKLTQQSLFESTWINTSDEDVRNASYLLQGLRLDSKTETTFPLKAEYNLDGTFKISFGAAVAHKPQSMAYYRSTGNYFSYASSNLYYESVSSETEVGLFDLTSLTEGDDKRVDIGGSAKLDLTVKYDNDLSDWRCVLGITVEGHAKADVLKVDIPVFYGVAGGYAKLSVGGSAEARWEPLTTYLSDIAGLAELSLDILPTKLKGGIEIKGGTGVYAIDSDIVSAGLYAKLNCDIHLMPQQKLVLAYDLGAEGKVLIWEPEQSLLSDKFEIRFGGDRNLHTMNLMSLMSADESTLHIAEVDDALMWNGDGPELEQGVFNGSVPRLTALDDGRLLLVFVDYDSSRNADNPVQLFYSIGSDSGWSNPRPIYDDGTIDLYPRLARGSDGKLYATWVNLSEALSEVSEMTTSDIMEQVYPKMTVATAVFDPASDTWSAPTVAGEAGCLKKSPQIASSGNMTITAWVQNSANASYGDAEHRDTVGYRITGADAAAGELDVGTGTITSLAAFVADGKAYLAYTREDEGVVKAYVRTYDGTWSHEKRVNETIYEDSFLRFVTLDGDICLYYVNNSRVHRFDLASGKTECVIQAESLASLLEFDVVDSENLIWLANVNGRTEAYLASRNGERSSLVQLELGRYDGMLQKISAASTDSGVAVSVIESTFSDENADVLTVRSFARSPELTAEGVELDHAFIPGVSNAFTLTVRNRGLANSEGFRVYCSPTEHISDAFGAPYEYLGVLDAGRSVSVIAEAELPASYSERSVYFLVEDSNGAVTAYRDDVLYDGVRINEVRKESCVPGKVDLLVDIDNYGYTAHNGMTLRLLDAAEETVAELTLEELEGNAGRNVTLAAEFGSSVEGVYTLELLSEDAEVLDSSIVVMTASDYQVLLGDYHCDGQVNPGDATALLQRIAYDKTDTERQQLAGDVTGNGSLEPNDVTAILQYCAGLIDNFGE